MNDVDIWASVAIAAILVTVIAQAVVVSGLRDRIDDLVTKVATLELFAPTNPPHRCPPPRTPVPYWQADARPGIPTERVEFRMVDYADHPDWEGVHALTLRAVEDSVQPRLGATLTLRVVKIERKTTER